MTKKIHERHRLRALLLTHASLALIVGSGLHAQNGLLRSNLGAAGGSTVRSANGSTWYVQQAVGQASVAGSYRVDGRYYNQGFVQPFHKAVRGLPSTDLEALMYPNPFADRFTIAFVVEPDGPVTVQVYNTMGQVVYAAEHAPQRHLMIQPGALATGSYVVHVVVGQRRFVGHLQRFQ
ncbi:MAG: T9SS type A sorting domain-containing protein [Flavobacteriales bacterium]|nr:T9SS type A sorting domain-containing protein [Flavobacteriales bacterium]